MVTSFLYENRGREKAPTTVVHLPPLGFLPAQRPLGGYLYMRPTVRMAGAEKVPNSILCISYLEVEKLPENSCFFKVEVLYCFMVCNWRQGAQILT